MATSSSANAPSKSSKRALIIESLAVKHRPLTLDDLVGQDHIAAEIRGMLKKGQFPSTMLFNGESGCGKTTAARMIARYILCKSPDPETFAPCGTCPSCRYGSSHPDIAEINMAEARGIDDVRALIQSSRNMPTIGENRIFIIDEVHAMTTQAAQAFLKPLEEPPSRTLWLLATTNPEKLPTTILGRCHRFDVRRIEPSVLVRRLYRIARREGTDFKTVADGMDILKFIADLADGRMRDSVNLLEKALFALASDSTLDKNSLLQSFLRTSDSDLEKASAHLVASVLSNDLKGMLKQVRGSQNARGILSKTRWLIQFLIDDAVGLAKYTPYNARLFAKISKDQSVKVNLSALVRFQYLLLEIESKFNLMSLDENVIMLSMLGNHMAQDSSSK